MEQMNTAKSSMRTALVIRMVLHCALSTKSLNEIQSTNARDLVCYLGIPKFDSIR